MNGLYSDYRGDVYAKIRRSWEPSYTSELNNDLGNSDSVLNARHDFVLDALTRCEVKPSDRVRTVVDVGGDRGQFIPRSIPNRFVVDVSNKRVTENVTRLVTIQDAIPLYPDLVMACGILEHLSKPIDFLQELLTLHSIQRSMLIYIEVPDGVPHRRPWLNRLLGNTCGRIAARSHRFWRALDSRSAALQILGKRGSVLMPLRQSEHINFFSEEGLRRIAFNAGLKVLLLDRVDTPSTLLRDGRLQFSQTLRLLAETRSK